MVTGIDQVQLQFTALVDTCGDNEYLTEQPWHIRSVQLTPGEAFGSLGFSEPFHFVMPDLPANEFGVGLSRTAIAGCCGLATYGGPARSSTTSACSPICSIRLGARCPTCQRPVRP